MHESTTNFAAIVGADEPISIAGGRTRWELGGELTPGCHVIEAPSGILAYQPAEMTVHVLAGTPVAELHAALAEHGQRTALSERGGTVGGAIAVGQNHLEMLGRGRLRDCVLQVRYVSAEGKIVTGGGPTVKNVTGFDLPRLLTGSLGTLGLIAEVIVRTNPIPTTRRWLRSDSANPSRVSDVVLGPSAVLWDGISTWVLLEGHEPDVGAQAEALATLGTFDEAEGPPPLPPHRWSVSPDRVMSLPISGRFVASIGTGLAFADQTQPPRPLSPAVQAVSTRLKALFDPTGRLNPGRQN